MPLRSQALRMLAQNSQGSPVLHRHSGQPRTRDLRQPGKTLCDKRGGLRNRVTCSLGHIKMLNTSASGIGMVFMPWFLKHLLSLSEHHEQLEKRNCWLFQYHKGK